MTQLLDSDVTGLPDSTIQFVRRVHKLGVDRTRMHGIFVLLGLQAAAPRPPAEMKGLFEAIDVVIPTDRITPIDETVGPYFDGYHQAINEFCYRSGRDFDFRRIELPESDRTLSIVELKDEGILETDVLSICDLASSFALFDALIVALGRSTAARNRGLKEAFLCGVFEMQLYARLDIQGASQVCKLLEDLPPLFYGHCIKTLSQNHISFFMGLTDDQIALIPLISSLDTPYAEQMWGYQSGLFFKDKQPIDGIEALDIEHWHAWIVSRAINFYNDHGSYILPFSLAGASHCDLPVWRQLSSDLWQCDEYIFRVYGYRWDQLADRLRQLEYRALLVHIIYLSLTAELEQGNGSV